MMNRLFSMALLTCTIVFAAGSQNIDSLLTDYNHRVPQEKVYIHFDNSLYTPGQTIWYKAYIVNGLEPSVISKNFYIDWVDAKGKLINRTIAPIINSGAAGSFTLPENYTDNGLQVKAYTKWMLNFDTAFFFNRTLSVAQFESKQSDFQKNASITTLQFFPEGGDLVENISSTIAFKAENSAGLPVEVNGVINNKTGQVISSFKTEHDGMGSIPFIPVAGESYSAEWKDPMGNTQFTKLPSIKNNGIVLTIAKESFNRIFTIQRTGVKEPRLNRVMIVATLAQQVLFRAYANLSQNEKITGSLPIFDFPSGIVLITVFDVNNQPLAERILFVDNEEYLVRPNFSFDTLQIGKRGKNVYEIEIPDSVSTNMSIAITDGEFGTDSSTNIISQLLLSDELKGYIHNPAYYFSSTADSVIRHLDLVMLTHGWRRFIWEDVFQRKIPSLQYLNDTSYLSLVGKIDDLSDKKIAKSLFINLILTGKDSNNHFISAPLQRDGSFGKDNLIFYDTTRIFYQLNNKYLPESKKVTITNNFLPFDSSKSFRELKSFLSDTSGLARIKSVVEEQKRLDKLKMGSTLQEVIVVAKKKTRVEELDEKYSSGRLSSFDDIKFNLVDDPTGSMSVNVFTYLQGRAPGLTIRNATTNPSAYWRGGLGQVNYYINDVKVDAAYLSTISMNYVALVKVLRGGLEQGAIVVYTKKGEDIRSMMGIDNIKMSGYSSIKQFYSPNYAEKKEENMYEKDLRKTLYWDANIQTDIENKKITVSFYNNDISQTFYLVLEGISADGRLIHFHKLLQ